MSRKTAKYSRAEIIASGALAGAVAANPMTLLRMWARRAGLIDKTVPQVMEEWLIKRLNLRVPGGHVGHHALDQLMHVGYGSMLGAISGVLFHRMRFLTVRRGIVVGLVTWAIGGFILMPLFGASRGAWKGDARENSINLAAHLLFGLGNALLTEEIFSQIERGPSDVTDRQATRVG